MEYSRQKILEWATISYSWDLPDPGTEPLSLALPALAGRVFFTTVPPGKPSYFIREMKIKYDVTTHTHLVGWIH